MDWCHIVADNRTNNVVRAIPEARTIVIPVPNNSSDCRGVGGDKGVFSNSRVGCSGGTSFSGSPNTWDDKTFSTSERTPNHGTSICITKNISYHVGSLSVKSTLPRVIFPLFNYIARRIFHLKDIGKWLIDTTASERGVGVSVFNRADITARADGDRETGGSVGTVGKITKLVRNL